MTARLFKVATRHVEERLEALEEFATNVLGTACNLKQHPNYTNDPTRVYPVRSGLPTNIDKCFVATPT
jgi:hypothetical protein